MKTRSIVNRKVQLAFGFALLALVAVGTVSYRAILASRESDRWVQHSYEVLENLNSLLAATESIEASYRGFALTGDESHFFSYRASIDNANKAERTVRDLTADNPVQQNRIPVLERLIAEKIQFDDTVVGLRRTRGLEAAGKALHDGSGQQIMSEFLNLVQQMQNEELRLLVLRNADAKLRLNQTRLVLFFGTLLGVLIAAGAGWIAQRDHSAREFAEDAWREGEERFGSVANNISQLAWMADPEGQIFWYNDRWFEYTGVTLEEMAASSGKKVLHPDHVQRVIDKFQQSFAAGEMWEDTFPMLGRDGKYRTFLSRAVPIRDAHGKVLRWFGTNTDITERQAMKDELFAEKERAQVTLNSIGDAVVCTDLEGNISFLNPVAEKMTGWSLEEASGRPMAEVLRIRDDTTREAIPDPMEQAVVKDQTLNLPPNCHLIRRDGTEVPIEDSVSPIHDRQGQAIGAVIVFRDVTEAQAMTRQMTHSAQHDFLTGLPNRMLLNDRVNQAIALAPRHKGKVAVLFLDLDGFKHINDSLGHPIGDKLLQSVAKRLTDCLRGSDTVSRQGGDEFVVLLADIEQIDDAAFTARRILQSIAAPHSIDNHELHITASIGISVHPDDGLDGATLIQNADTAMYHAKEHGPQQYEFFMPEMNVRAVARQSIEESLRRALERQEFAVHYQPKVDLRTGAITGAEALLRWAHPTRGMVAPGEFIPVAEDCGLILPIGNWVLRESCRQARAWLDSGLPLLSMAVNISAMEFRDKNFLEGVFSILDQTGLDPSFLELELTEGVLMKSAESTESILNTLRARGVQVAIDDFGTGYSSLSYLTKFPIDALKIDQSFVHRISIVPDGTAIVVAIVSMGRSLNMRVVAEGVETPEEARFLLAHHCDEAQGYYFSRPVPAAHFAKLLEAGIPKEVSALG
jgi:diguanylate cyclase (GGDEF)-like protein/PAS domain S-box-containing protein